MPREAVNVMAYARVSTPKQTEGNGLDIQAWRLQGGCEREGWTLLPEGKVLQEPFTGTTDDRPVYRAAIHFIKKHPGLIKYFVVAQIDRFSREGAARYQEMKSELLKLGVELRDLTGIIQPQRNSLEDFGFAYDWSLDSPSQLNEIITAEMGRLEKATILTRMVGPQIKLTQEGYHIGQVPDGYVSKRISVEGKRRYALVPDPDRSFFFREMFRLRADGTYSDEEIVHRINALGFRTRAWKRWSQDHMKVVGLRAGVPLTVKQLQRFIRRPIYCGVVCEKWTHGLPIRARGGEPVISIEAFNRANRGRIVLEEHADGSVAWHVPESEVVRRKAYNPEFPCRGVVLCSQCLRPLTASYSRGKSGRRFGAYHCARKHDRYAVSQPYLEDAFFDFLASLRMTDGFVKCLELHCLREYEKAVKSRARTKAHASREIKPLEEERSRLADAFSLASSESMRRELEAKVTTLDDRIEKAREVRDDLEIGEADIRYFAGYAGLLMEHPAMIAKSIANQREQQAIYSLFFPVRPTCEKILNGTPDLAPTLAVSQRFKKDKSEAMNRLPLTWNSIVREIRHWQGAYWALDILAERCGLKKRRSV